MPESWTVKDQLAHLTAWRQVAVVEMAAVRTGGPGPDVSDDDDVENAKIYEKTHRQPAASIREAGKRSWNQLAAAVEACSDTDLAKPRVRRPEQQLWQMIPHHTYFHLAEHLAYRHTDRGDEAAAENAAKWAHDLATSTFSDNRSHGDKAGHRSRPDSFDSGSRQLSWLGPQMGDGVDIGQATRV